MGIYDSVRQCTIRVRLAEATVELEGALPSVDELTEQLAAGDIGEKSAAVRDVLVHAVSDLAYLLAELDAANERVEDAWKVIDEIDHSHRSSTVDQGTPLVD